MRLFFSRFSALTGLQLFALLGVALANIATANAATLTVTTTADSGAGSLRGAIAAAGAGDTIQFDPALNGQTINLTSGELAIDQNITVSGPGPNLLTVSSSGTFRIFHVLPGRIVILGGLTIRNGFCNGGGGVLNDHATLTINNCIIRQNSTQGSFGRGGGVYTDGSAGSATSTILDSTVSNNGAAGYGGGIYNDAHNAGSVTLSLMNSSVISNSAANYSGFGDGRGGGIYSDGAGVNITITNSSVSNNSAGSHDFPFPFGFGGGIYGNGILTITNSTINGNTVGASGGGIMHYGTLTLTSSTVSNNSAFGTHDGMNWNSTSGGIDSNGTVTITNSTFSGNSAIAYGGAIGNYGVLTMAITTLSGNTAIQNGGGIYNANGRTFELGNTILKAGASGANIFNNGGTVTSHGYSLSSDNGSGLLTASGDQINTDPILGPLQNNGGPTFTHDLLTGSPALDAGDPNFTPPPLSDQRGPGYARVFNGRIDIGSLEVQPAPTPTPTPTPTPCPLQPWTFVADYPLPVIEQNAMGSDGVFAYSAGGATFPSETNAFYRYDPVANSWTTLAPLPASLLGAGGVYAANTNSFYVFGGHYQSSPLSTTYVYNVGTNTWTTGAAMPAPRYLPNVAYYGATGKIYVIGGSSGASQTWEYDPVANTWITTRLDIPAPMGGSATSIVGQFIYLIANLDGSTLHYRYDIPGNTWSLMAAAPEVLYQPVGAAIGNQVYVVGGPGTPPHTGTYIYDIASNSWTTGPNTNIPHAYAGGTAIGNRLLIVGGYVYSAADTNMVEITTTSCAPTPTPTPSPSPTPTATATATATPTATATATATPTATATAIVSPTPGSLMYSISGTASYCTNPAPGPVPNVTLTLAGSASDSTLSNGSGDYLFSFLPQFGNYTVTPSKTALPPGSPGINTVDSLAAQKHFLGRGTPLSGCQLAAADVNGDSAVNTVDAIAIQRFYFLQSTGVANVGKYQFTPASRTYPNLVDNQSAQNYDTLVLGDVAAPFAEP